MSYQDDQSDFFFFNDTATTEIYTLSLHDALPICGHRGTSAPPVRGRIVLLDGAEGPLRLARDRKSTRLNSSHANISYAVFCLKKKKGHPGDGEVDPVAQVTVNRYVGAAQARSSQR